MRTTNLFSCLGPGTDCSKGRGLAVNIPFPWEVGCLHICQRDNQWQKLLVAPQNPFLAAYLLSRTKTISPSYIRARSGYGTKFWLIE